MEKISRYQIIKEIGRGGMGRVFKAYDPMLQRDIALKLRIKEEFSQRDYDRFVREAQSTAKLRHPHIVRFYDIGEENQHVFFTMDLIRGYTLSDLIDKGKLTIRQSLKITEKIARAVHYAHTEGIVHRDIKPGNIMITTKGKPMLMDFGLAKELEEESTKISQTGVIVGTVAYMPPEQVDGEATVLSDVYSLGAVLYKLLTKKLPFVAESSVKMIFKIIGDLPTPPSSINPEVCPGLEAICLKALAKNPQDRYQSALEFAEDLRHYLRHEPTLAKPPTITVKTAIWLRRNKSRFTTYFLLMTTLFLMAIVASLFFFPKQPKKVMLLFSYEQDLLWDQQIKAAIIKTFDQSVIKKDSDIIIQEHYMETKKYSQPQQIKERVKKAVLKIKEFQPHLVIAVDDNAAGKVIPHFFHSDIQFIFCGVNNNPQAYYFPQKNVSGVRERLLLAQTLNMIPYFLPKAKRYIVAVEDSVSSRIVLPDMEKELRSNKEYDRMGTLVSAKFSEWQAFLKQYEAKVDFVVVPIYLNLKDDDGNHVKPETVMQWIVDNISKPPIGVLDFNIKHGALLGVVDSGSKQGSVAGQYALQVLTKGKKAGELEIADTKRGDLYINKTTAEHYNIKIPAWVYQFATIFE